MAALLIPLALAIPSIVPLLPKLPEVVKWALAVITGVAVGIGAARTVNELRQEKDVVISALSTPETQVALGITKEEALRIAIQIAGEFTTAATGMVGEYLKQTETTPAEARSVAYEARLLASTGILAPQLAEIAETRARELVAYPAEQTVTVPTELPAEYERVITAPPGALPGINIDTSPIAAALPAIGIALAQTMLATAGQTAHAGQAGRVACQGTTGWGILNQLVNAAAPLATVLAIEKFNPLRESIDGLFNKMWDEILNTPGLKGPIKPEGAPELSRALFFTAMKLGMTAHLTSVVAESFSPLKSLGLGYLSAFLTDMAGFSKIGGAMMSAIESQALVKPFGYFINARTRPVLPGTGDLLRLAGEYALVSKSRFDELTGPRGNLELLDKENKAQFLKYLPYQGITPDLENNYYELADTPERYFLLRAMADSGMWDETYYRRALCNSGYNTATISQALGMLYRMAHGELKAISTSVALRRYREGMDNQAKFTSNLLTLGIIPQLIPKYIYSADLERSFEQWQEEKKAKQEKPRELQPVMLATAIKRFKEGMDTEQAFSTNLVFLGIDPRILERYTYAARLERDYDDTMDYIAALKDATVKGILAPDDFHALLLEKGITPEKAAIVTERVEIRTYKPPKPKQGAE